ncbi:MAG TPA: STAS domain-containing protein [Acidimicrobiales bacterium]|nr:STAS domain-containing protein [Acidimicrobiales bacterium]
MTLTTQRPSARRAPQLVVSMSTEGPASVVALQGEADNATLPLVTRMLDRAIRAHDGPVVVELAGTRFIDSGTVRIISQVAQALAEHGRRLTVRSPSELAVRVLELHGLSDLIVPGGGEDQ